MATPAEVTDEPSAGLAYNTVAIQHPRERRRVDQTVAAEDDLMAWYVTGTARRATTEAAPPSTPSVDRLISSFHTIQQELNIGTERDAKGKGKRRGRYAHPLQQHFVLPAPVHPTEAIETAPPNQVWEPRGEPITDQDFVEYTGDPDTCSICLSQYRHNEMLIWLACMHIFHQECLTHYLSQ